MVSPQSIGPDGFQLPRVLDDVVLSNVGNVYLLHGSGRFPIPVLQETVDFDRELDYVDGEDWLHTSVDLAEGLPDVGQEIASSEDL